MKCHKVTYIVLTLVATSSVAIAEIDKSNNGIESQHREQVQYLGQALLKARASKRKEMEGRHRETKTQMASIHKALLDYQHSLLEVQTDNTSISLALPASTQPTAQQGNKTQRAKQRPQTAIGQQHQRIKTVLNKTRAKLSKNKNKNKSQRAQLHTKKLRNKLQALDIEIDNLPTLPHLEQLASIKSLIKQTRLRKRRELTQTQQEQAQTPDIPSISVRIQHR